MRRGQGILLLTTAVLVLSGCSGGATDQRPAIAKAVRSYVFSSGCCELSAVDVERIRISHLDHDYATAHVDGFARPNIPIAGLTAVLSDDGSGWSVLGLGTTPSSLGCGVPASVATELGLACGTPA